MIFDRHANLKYKYGNRHFWARGYYVDTVGQKQKANTRIHKESITRRSNSGSDKYKRVCGPVYGEREQESIKTAP